MSVEENKAIVRRFIEAKYTRNADVNSLDEFICPDYGSEERGIRGLEEYRQRFIDNSNSFMAECEGTIEEMIAEGDKVVVRGTWSGTHKGTFRGIAPTGKRWTIGVMIIYQLADGKIVDERMQVDWLSIWRQIGAYPPP